MISGQQDALVPFFQRVWPDSGRKCLAFKTPTGMAHRWFSHVDEAAHAARDLDAGGHDVYFGVAGFSQDKRDAASAQAAKSFWFDIDCGEGKPYPSQAEGLSLDYSRTSKGC